MKKLLTLAVLLSLLSGAEADKYEQNLAPFRANELCFSGVTALYNGEKDDAESQRLTTILKQQDALYGLNFTKNLYSECLISGYIYVEDGRNGAGTYAYTYELIIYAADFKIRSARGDISLKHAAFYDMSGFGTTGSLDALKERYEEVVKDMYQDLILDWRKTH